MKVVLATNFHEFSPGYSLTGIVTDQIKMLVRYGHDVHLLVSEQYNPHYDHLIPDLDKITVHRTVPDRPLIDYSSMNALKPETQAYVDLLVPYLREELKDVDICLTHDWIFQGWYLPFALALMALKDETRHVGFLHWVHSIPTGFKDWWYLEHYGTVGAPLPGCWPKNHKLVSPTETNLQHLAEQFRCTKEHVITIPHIKDPRTWFEFGDDTQAFIDDHPGVMHADVVGIYPASCDRLSAKQVQHVIGIFGAMKRRSLKTCLIVANQWASKTTHRETIDSYYELADTVGLTTVWNRPADNYAEEFIFTSEWQHPTYELGIPRRMLRELMLLSNLFVFPTREESFGLVAPEAALCGNFVVLNKDLQSLAEVFCHQGAYFSFGSLTHNFKPDSWERYLDAVAGATLARMNRDEAVMTQTFVRQRLNFDFLYHRAYEPAFQELKLCS